MVKESRAYASDPEAFRRRSYAEEDKSWEAKGVDPLEVIERVSRLDRVVAMQLELQWALGLRVEESFLLRPVQALGQALEPSGSNAMATCRPVWHSRCSSRRATGRCPRAR